jgi:molecular chaperone HscA
MRAAIEAKAAALEAVRTGGDHRAIHAAIEALDEAARPFAEARMNRSLGRVMAGRRVDEVERGLP